MTKTEPLLTAFHGDQAIKDKYLARVAEHRRLDHLVRGATGQNGKGCAVWCTLNKYDHAAYEDELGIPRSIARLEDGLFESLPIELAMDWPTRFLEAIRPGSDLSLVMPRFFLWLLVDPEDGVIRFAKTNRTRDAIQKVADLYTSLVNGAHVTTFEFKYAADAAYAAYAADAAYADAYAAYAAAYAAYADAYAAYAAAYAAYAAAYAAAAYAADAARSLARVRQADKLIQLLMET